MCTNASAPKECGARGRPASGFPVIRARSYTHVLRSTSPVMHFRVRNCPFESQMLFPDLTQNRTIALCTSSSLDLMDVESAAPNPPLCRLSTEQEKQRVKRIGPLST